MRQSRKMDHLKYTLELGDGPGTTGFSDLTLIHNCLTGLAWDQITLATSFAGLNLKHPIIFNAITGGATDVTIINSRIASLAKLTGSAMAVGSQFSALESRDVWESYEVVRRIYPDGIVFANIGAYATVEQARIAVDMIGANALQIHLNVAQEIIMTEGDRDFRGYLENIANIAAKLTVPVIAKEVGCGISREAAASLSQTGIRAIDIAGRGGTNFVAIEAARANISLHDEIIAWGIPTAISAFEVASVLPKQVGLIVSGGIRTPQDCIKAMAIGGSAIASAAPILRVLQGTSPDEAAQWLDDMLFQLKRLMLLVGASNISKLQTIPIMISGFTREWLTARNIEVTQYCNR